MNYGIVTDVFFYFKLCSNSMCAWRNVILQKKLQIEKKIEIKSFSRKQKTKLYNIVTHTRKYILNK